MSIPAIPVFLLISSVAEGVLLLIHTVDSTDRVTLRETQKYLHGDEGCISGNEDVVAGQPK